MIPARELTIYVSVAAVLAFILSCGTPRGARMVWFNDKGGLSGMGETDQVVRTKKMPDFHHYQPTRVLSEDEFPLDARNRRTILVGDIHGMSKPFHQLLAKVQYNPNSDVIIHTGDFLAKGFHHHSMEILDYMTTHNITGVRGNHDQQVLEWRGWINWICSTAEGCDWLRRTEHHWRVLHGSENPNIKDDEIDKASEADLDDFIANHQKNAPSRDRRWWKLIPAGWKFLSGQYRIAREMKLEHYNYLMNLPLALYVPSAHTFVVHAGVLPSDPRFPYYDASRQPLAHVPDTFSIVKDDPLCRDNQYRCINHLRRLQELSILTDVPQNKRPWTLMNMRGVKNGKVFRKYRGAFWAKLWNRDMKRCVGYGNHPKTAPDDGDEEDQGEGHNLPCYPSTVVYGHSASRGLAYRRWSIGLDSGCVYGRKLTALVIGGPKRGGIGSADDDVADLDGEGFVGDLNDDDDYSEWAAAMEELDEGDRQDDEDDDDDLEGVDKRSDRLTETSKRKRRKKKQDGDSVAFGDHYKAKIVSIKCH